MSKKVVTKKKAEAESNGAAPPAPKAPAATDARIAKQLRVLETVTTAAPEKDVKTYSPRTESHIKQLSDVLDFFEFSRSDIAALVRRCHYDEHQIQIAVANIIEEKEPAVTEWGTVRNKKQVKEEKQIKAEEDKKEQERLEKEREKQRREAEKQAQREAERARNSQKSKAKEPEVEAVAAALPPDPAILFAGPKPAASRGEPERGQDEWWDGVTGTDSANDKYWDWDGKEEGAQKNGNEWSWSEDTWGQDWEGGKKGGSEWQEGAWKDAGVDGKKQRGAKTAEKGGGAGGGKKDSEMWDMPDTTGKPANEGGLDQWALGDIRAHERATNGTKVLPASMMRTLEDVEREQFGVVAAAPAAPAVQASPSAPPTAPPTVAATPMSAPPTSPPVASQRPRQDPLPAPQDLMASGAIGAPIGAGDKGRGKGAKGGKGGKGERIDRPDRPDRPERPDKPEKPAGAAAESEKERMEKIDRSDDPRRQPVEEHGENVTVRKHSSMGCAVVTMKDTRVREVLVKKYTEFTINGIKVQVKPHTEKETKADVPTDIFVAWGRQVEKTTPLSERELTKFFDTHHREVVEGWRAEEEKTKRAEEAARQQKLQEEQRRQQAELQVREEQRKRFEEERRRVEEAQLEQRRLVEEEQRRRAESQQVPWMNRFGQQPQQAAGHPDMSVAAGHAAAVPGYPQQWGASQQQWMQAMAYSQAAAAGWQQQQQLAQRSLQQQMSGMPNMAGSPQDYDALRAAAYYTYMTDQSRGQGNAGFAVQQHAGYPQQNPAAYNYGAGAAAGFGRGERI